MTLKQYYNIAQPIALVLGGEANCLITNERPGCYVCTSEFLVRILCFGVFFQSGKTPIKDMFTDLRDGRKLLDLLEGLTGSTLVCVYMYEYQVVYIRWFGGSEWLVNVMCLN